MKYFIILLLLSGCAREINIEFEPYTNQFVMDSILVGHYTRISHIIVEFGQTDRVDAKTVYAAECSMGAILHTPKITVDKFYWDKYDDNQKEALIYHELGHCILYRQHREDILFDKCPASIMYPIVIDSDCFEAHREEYIRELFENKGK